jgi:hypothetical protein
MVKIAQFAVFGCPDLSILTIQATPGKSVPLVTPQYHAITHTTAPAVALRAANVSGNVGMSSIEQPSRFAGRVSMLPAAPAQAAGFVRPAPLLGCSEKSPRQARAESHEVDHRK